MAWIAMSDSNHQPQSGSLEDGLAVNNLIGDSIGPNYQGVPLCGPAMCAGKGMPPTPLARPGIDCVYGDQPCLPCDIVNIKLRIAVTGPWLKRAVAECQKRYFCSVWNILFSWLFPDHKPAPCYNLRSGDQEVVCRRKLSAADKAGPMLPYGADPRRMRIAEKIEAATKAPMVALDNQGSPIPPPELSSSRPPSSVSTKGKLSSKRRSRGYLLYNIWEIPMPDTSKDKQQMD